MLHLKYRPDIDGLRAVAVLSVVLFHAFPALLAGGFVGVDIFFVISGYLITGIILGSLAAGSFSFAEFYARRVRRILPALLIVLLTCLAVGWTVLLTSEYAILGKHTVATTAFLQNFALWQEGGYFDTDSRAKPLLHLWSLGIEEQFYLIWPLALWLMRKNIRLAVGVTLTIAFACLASSIAITPTHHVAAFYSPVTRFWELMAGALLACFPARKFQALPSWSGWFSGVGLLLIAYCVFRFDGTTPFSGGWAILPVLGAVLVIAARPETGFSRAMLSHPWTVFVGKISYPLYLWHWPLLAFAFILCNGTPPLSWRIICLVAGVILAALTYLFLERKIRFRQDARSLVILAVLNIFVAALGGLCWLGVIPSRHNERSLEIVIAALGDQMRTPAGFHRTYAGKQPVYSMGGATRKTLFIGDSHMEQYEPRIEQVLSDKHDSNAAIVITHPSCSVFPIGENLEGCTEMRTEIAKALIRTDVDTVVIGGHWMAFAEEPIGYAQFSQKLSAYLGTLVGTKRVFLLLDNPFGESFDPHGLIAGRRWDRLTYDVMERRAAILPEQMKLRELMSAVAYRFDVEILDPDETLCRDGKCLVTLKDGRPLYLDRHHLRPFYVRQYAKFLDASLAPRVDIAPVRKN